MNEIWDYARYIVGGEDRAGNIHKPATIEEIAAILPELKRLIDEHDKGENYA